MEVVFPPVLVIALFQFSLKLSHSLAFASYSIVYLTLVPSYLSAQQKYLTGSPVWYNYLFWNTPKIKPLVEMLQQRDHTSL